MLKKLGVVFLSLSILACAKTINPTPNIPPYQITSLYNEEHSVDVSNVLAQLQDSQIQVSRMLALALYLNAELYILNNNVCPQLKDIVAANEKENLVVADLWGTDYTVSCDKELKIISAGPDLVFGTTDDIVVP